MLISIHYSCSGTPSKGIKLCTKVLHKLLPKYHLRIITILRFFNTLTNFFFLFVFKLKPGIGAVKSFYIWLKCFEQSNDYKLTELTPWSLPGSCCSSKWCKSTKVPTHLSSSNKVYTNCMGMEFFRQRGVTGLLDNFPIQQ